MAGVLQVFILGAGVVARGLVQDLGLWHLAMEAWGVAKGETQEGGNLCRLGVPWRSQGGPSQVHTNCCS